MVEPVTSEIAEATRDDALTDLELTLLLEAVLRFSGHDFTDYAQVTLKRRIDERMRAENVQTISGLQERLLHDREALSRFIFSMSGGRGRFFADPSFFRVFRRQIAPLLRTYSFTRIWIPNCACGEDAYSIAVLLKEEGLLERTMIYATDASEAALAAAREGVYEIEAGDNPGVAYAATGAGLPLAELCEIGDGKLRFGEDVKRHIIFAKHSLVTDGSLNEFHVIVARGVLRHFNRALQFRVHNLFLSSLIRLGFLCLGYNESLQMTPHEGVFRRLVDDAPIYRRMR
ncbi:MAG: protein-glutamate O-methyltransferase CheR [Candidatus Eremiobacteraeota bacterium]|nr:protein-glutamate O-methyltransferase CheR [Candidatus Eremiobacteraeota bacterium]